MKNAKDNTIEMQNKFKNNQATGKEEEKCVFDFLKTVLLVFL